MTMSQRQGRFDKSCHYSTLRNTSGVAKTFGFLPPHGVKLDVDEEYSVFGDIRSTVGRGDPATDRRHHQALVDALDRQDILILSTPSPVLLDATDDVPQILSLDNGTLSAVDPCWDTSDSADAEVAT
jgi:hypothetical protein